jgi:lipopolysaccharide/colanic/teichoic acid biosynthesis glycosyltransferase
MTTPDFAIHDVPSKSHDSLRTTTRPQPFRNNWPLQQLQLLADGTAIFTGVFLGSRWGIVNLNSTVAMSRLILTSTIAAIAVIFICRHLNLYKADFSPLKIATTERLVRAMTYLWVSALAGCILVNRSFVFAVASAGLCASIILATERGIRTTVQRIVRSKSCIPPKPALVEKTHGVRQVEDGEDHHSANLGCVFSDYKNSKAALDVQVGRNNIKKLAPDRGTAAIALAMPQIQQHQAVSVVGECESQDPGTSWALGPGYRSDRGPRHRPPCELEVQARSGHPAESLLDLGRRGIDILGASAMLLAVAPVFTLVAALIKIDSRGPVFFRHARVGRHARHFDMWKFRTMRADVDRYQRSPTSDGDPRLTRVGRILRRTSVDELPQLINVLRGDMSLVGPRPEMPFIAAKHNALARSRVRVKPGMTGLWQISPARAFPIHENIEYDLFYVDHQNLFLDCAILLRTLTAVVRGMGAA